MPNLFERSNAGTGGRYSNCLRKRKHHCMWRTMAGYETEADCLLAERNFSKENRPHQQGLSSQY